MVVVAGGVQFFEVTVVRHLELDGSFVRQQQELCCVLFVVCYLFIVIVVVDAVVVDDVDVVVSFAGQETCFGSLCLWCVL